MSLRIGWLSPFSRKTGVGTFSKAVTDAMPAEHRGEAVDLTVVAPVATGMYRTRHRFADIASVRPDSRFYDLFDVLVCNIGNNTEHHKAVVDVLRNVPSVIVCHDYVYQHYLATIIYEQRHDFTDYVALNARFGRADALRTIRQSNLTRGRGLAYAPWDSEFSGSEPLGAPLLKLGSALVVHSEFAERYARRHFAGPVLRLGMPHDQRADPAAAAPASRSGRTGEGRLTIMSFGHVQSTKCIDDVLQAIAGSDLLRESVLYVISGFAGSRDYVAFLRGLVEDLDLRDCVRFELDVSDAELNRLSASADAFVNLRYPNTEGASVSLIEQLVTAKPVVVVNSGCYAELPDDAVVKVARPRDVGAVRDAILRLVRRRDDHAAIGQRGRAYAMRHDCRGYVTSLLDFVMAEREMLRRRATMTARCLVDVETPDAAAADDERDEAWLDALDSARTSLDLLDEGRLSLDPDLIRAIDADGIVDYVLAAILREGTNQRLAAALRLYFAGQSDPYPPVRLLDIVHRAGPGANPAAREVLAEICPHGDLLFWDVVASLGPATLATILYHAVFRAPPPDNLLAALAEPRPSLAPELLIAAAAERADRASLACPEDALEALLAHLVASALERRPESLEALTVGRSVTIGSSEHDRYLRLSGFFDPETDHAWTGAGPGLVYLRPSKGVKRIVVSGYGLHPDASVSFSAAPSFAASSRMTVRPHPVSCQLGRFEIELADLPDESPMPLCLAIHSTSPRSPADLGISPDNRPLGFCLTRIAAA